MATESTASSGTEGSDPQLPDDVSSSPAADGPIGAPVDATAEPGGLVDGATANAEDAVAAVTQPQASDTGRRTPGPPEPDVDPERRAFFLEFGKQAVVTVGQVAGMANIVGRTSSSAAANLLGLDEKPAARPPATVLRSAPTVRGPLVSTSSTPLTADDAYRSPYRLAGDELVLLDQRTIPESLDEVTCKRGSDVAYYLRIGVCRGGPIMAQVAAYGMALTAVERQGQPTSTRDVELRRTRRSLVEARVSSRLIGWAIERMEAAEARLDETATGPELAAALREEADAIATGFQVDHTEIASHLAAALPQPTERPLGVLLHGDTGALAGGSVGTGLAALQRLAADGRALSVYVTEARPFMDGARLVSWQLRQVGIEHKIVTDSAVAWLLAREAIDVVLLGAEWVAMNGDVATVVGGRAVAQQAAAARAATDGAGPLVFVSSVSAALDRNTPSGADIPDELRPTRDLAAYLRDVPIHAADALVPASDVIPAALIDTLVTEHGPTTPVDAAAMEAIAERSHQREVA